ncbi:hypothetical protein D3C87_1711170 [compost metagenome]
MYRAGRRFGQIAAPDRDRRQFLVGRRRRLLLGQRDAGGLHAQGKGGQAEGVRAANAAPGAYRHCDISRYELEMLMRMTRISFAIVMSCNGPDTFIFGLIVSRGVRTTQVPRMKPSVLK